MASTSRRPLLLAACVGAAIALAVVRPGPLAALDLRVYDALVRGDRTTTGAAQTAIVAIDEASLARLGQWPWPRPVLAAIVERLGGLGATAVGFDVLLVEPDRTLNTGDADLAVALSRQASVTGYALVFDEPATTAEPCIRHPLELVERHDADTAPSAGLFVATGGVCSLPELAEAAGASGFLNAAPDPDGVLRRVPLVARVGDRVYPSLALAVARRAAGGGAVRLDARSDGSMALRLGGRTVALDARGRLLVRAAQSLASRTPLSAADLLDGRVDPARIRGRAVLVGATALGLGDTVVTAAGDRLPGVVVHAAVVDTLLGSAAYERGEFAAVTEVASAALAALVVGLLARAGLTAAALAGAGMAGFGWWACQALLSGSGRVLSPLWLGLAIVVTLTAEGVAAIARERGRAEREARRRADAQRLTVQALTTLTETRDLATGHHARRTQAYTRALATSLAADRRYRRTLTAERIALISTLAPLHDIGKVGVTDAVLRKPGALTPDELAEMRRHPGIGHDSLLRAEALAGVHDDEVIALAKEIVYTHHERWDGTGYPRGLRGTDIPLSGRLVAVVDAYDAMVEHRSYQAVQSHEEAIAAIAAGRGQHYDPDVVDALLRVQEQFRSLGPGSRAGASAGP